jgi:hypothetical protein
MSKPPPSHPYYKKIAIQWRIEVEREGGACTYIRFLDITKSLVG